MDVALGAVGAITLFVGSATRSKEFYERIFAHPPVFEDDVSVAFRLDHLVVNLLEISAAFELVAPAPVAADEAGARFQLTIDVDDVDDACSVLAARGVHLLNGPIDRPWGIRTASFKDPDGHIWEIAHPLR
jgi:catechol 2,3-dioxygenase-like lactoylglutathione lyase family enzyme